MNESNWGGILAGGLGGLLLGGLINGNGLIGQGGRAATQEDLASGFNFAGVNGKLNELVAGQADINQNFNNGITQLGYQQLNQSNLLGSKIDNCCCNTQRAVDSVKFDMANYASALQIGQMQSTKEVLDKLSAMEMAQKDAIIQQQGQRITALESDIRMCGVPKISSYAYGIYPYPVPAASTTSCTNF